MPLKIYCERGHSPNFWERFWKERLHNRESLLEYYQSFKKPPYLIKIFKEYLPKEGKILDAGCGSGVWTQWLRQRGYEAEGLDISQEAVHAIRSTMPDLSIRQGSVFALDYPDRTFKGYLCLGVIGYFPPEKILQEAIRVLDNGGIAILRVPYCNPLRRLKAALGFYRNLEDDSSQLTFTPREMAKAMERVGLKVLKIEFYDSAQGFRDEILGARNSRKKSPRQKGNKARKSLILKLFDLFPLRFLFSHTLIVVAKKP